VLANNYSHETFSWDVHGCVTVVRVSLMNVTGSFTIDVMAFCQQLSSNLLCSFI